MLTFQSLTDPKVKKRLMMVFHAWSIQYAVSSLLAPDAATADHHQDNPRMSQIKGLYAQYGGGGPGVRKVRLLSYSRH
jgi:hypothetical protein